MRTAEPESRWSGCFVTLALWQRWQSLHHLDLSVAIPAHNHLEDISLCVALIPGWASEWTAVKAAMQKAGGRSGLGRLVEKSHSSCSSPKVAMETLREGLAFRASTSGHETWLAATAAISKQEVRNGRLL